MPRGMDGDMEAAYRKWPGRPGPRPHPVTPRPGTLPEPSKFFPTLAPLETVLESVRPCSCEQGPAHGLILPEAQTQTQASLHCQPPLKGCEGGSLVLRPQNPMCSSPEVSALRYTCYSRCTPDPPRALQGQLPTGRWQEAQARGQRGGAPR